MMKHIFLNHSPNTLETWKEAFPSLKEIPRGEFVTLRAQSDTLCWLRIAYKEIDLSYELTRKIKERLPEVKLVVMSDVPDNDHAATLFTLGVDGYCNSRSAPDVLFQIANVVEKGGMWVGPEIMRRLVLATAKAKAAPAVLKGVKEDLRILISPREWSVAQMVAGGASNKEVAKKFKISERTVKAHLSSIFEKTGTRDRLQLAIRVNGLEE